MSRFLGPVLRRLFSARSDDMPHQATQVGVEPIDPIGALNAAIDMHETINAHERSSYEARLRDTMDDLLKRLDKRAPNG